jgi:hypothetical protein
MVSRFNSELGRDEGSAYGPGSLHRETVLCIKDVVGSSIVVLVSEKRITGIEPLTFIISVTVLNSCRDFRQKELEQYSGGGGT